MDKLKYIKLENEDGTYSDSIPLAVDSDHVDINGNTLTNELANKANNSNINNLQSQINGLASGSPLVANQISDMIDTTRTYVNTTDGNWYYYNGTNWVIGGIYQSTSLNTDKTLSIINGVADAQTTGDDLRRIIDLDNDLNSLKLWEQGSINLTTGETVESTNRIRTKDFVNKEVEKCFSTWFYKFVIYIYDLSGNFESATEVINEYTFDQSQHKYKIALRKWNPEGTTLPNNAVGNIYLIAKQAQMEKVLLKNENLIVNVDFTRGSFNGDGTILNTTSEYALRSTTFIKVKKGTVIKPLENDILFMIVLFNNQAGSSFYKSYLWKSSEIYIDKDCYLKFAIKYLDEHRITDFSIVKSILSINELLDNVDEKVSVNKEIELKPDYFNLGSLQNTGIITESSTRVVTTDFIPCSKWDGFTNSDATSKFSVAEYSDKNEASFTSFSGFSDDNTKYTFKKTGYFRMARAYNDNRTLNDESIATLLSTITTNIHTREDLPILSNNIQEIKDEQISLKNNINNINEKVNVTSPFEKDDLINFGNVPDIGFFESLVNDHSQFDRDTTSTEFYSALDSLIGNNSRFTKTKLGESVQGKPIYEYTCSTRSVNVDNQTSKQHPLIMINSGIQGNEKSSIYAVYYFIKNMMEHWEDDDRLSYLYNHVDFKFIPIGTPDCFDNYTYVNANGVNINRNFDTPEYTPGGTGDQYAGNSAFDQPETVVIRDWILNNKDRAFIYIDFHTQGPDSVIPYVNQMNWISLPYYTDNDSYLEKLKNASLFHIDNITPYFNSMYNLNLDANSKVGHVSLNSNVTATSKRYAQLQNIISVTFETFPGFTTDTELYSSDTIKASTELIINYLMTLLNYYKN